MIGLQNCSAELVFHFDINLNVELAPALFKNNKGFLIEDPFWSIEAVMEKKRDWVDEGCQRLQFGVD